MKNKNIIKLAPAVLLSYVSVSCYKPVEKKQDTTIGDKQVENSKEETTTTTTTKYSLEILSNIELPSVNYSINVNDLTKIDSGTEVVITNNPGKYRIFMYKDIETDEVLSYSRNYSFNITKDTKIMIYSIYDKEYYEYYKGEDPIDLNVILMAGQSNMSGINTYLSTLDTAVKEEYVKGTESVVINYNQPRDNINTQVDGVPKLSSGTFVKVDYGQGTQFGPEIGLAKYLSTHDKTTKYFLIKVSCPGTSLSRDWNPDNESQTFDYGADKKYMYGIFKRSVQNCLNTLNSFQLGRSELKFKAKIKAMCWLQGESDSEYSGPASNYNANFNKLKNKVKSDFGEYYSDDFKWISASIHQKRCEEGLFGEMINTALQENSDRFIEETYSLSLGSDDLHYIASSSLTIGECFGREILN